MRFLALLGCLFLFGLPVFSASNRPTEPIFSVEFVDLPAPTNLQITAVTPTSVSAVWDPVAGANAYYVVVQDVVSNAIAFAGQVSSTNITVTNLNSATKYTLSVQAVDPSGYISQNEATVEFLTPYIITDDIIVENFKNPQTVPDCSTIPLEINDNIVLGLQKGNTEPIPFRVTLNSNGLIIGHENVIDDLGDYQPGWHFAKDPEAPPVLTSVQIFQDFETYTLEEVANANDFFTKAKLEVVIGVEKAYGGFKLCLPQGNTDFRVVKNIVRPGRGKMANQSQSTPPEILPSPNPFDDELIIQLPTSIEQNATLRLIHANGELVRTQKLEGGETAVSFETSDLPTGVYVLQYETANEVKTFKVIKTKG